MTRQVPRITTLQLERGFTVEPRDLNVGARHGRRTSQALLHVLIAVGMDPVIAKRTQRQTPKVLHATLLAAMRTAVRDGTDATATDAW